MNRQPITSAPSFDPLTEADLTEIHAMFRHTARSWGGEQRDLRPATVAAPAEKPLSFCLRSVFPSNTR